MSGIYFAELSGMKQMDDKNINILVVDPDEDFAQNVKMFLEETYSVTTTQRIEHLDNTKILNHIDVIVLAVEAVDGVIELLKQFRSNHEKVKIIIMYTYFSSDKEIEKSLANHADDMISKPFDVALLKNKVDSLLIPGS